MKMEMIMPTAFYWGVKVTFLFPGAKINSVGYYLLACIFTFALGLVIELLNIMRHNIAVNEEIHL